MTPSAALAEVKFPQYTVNLYGRVEQMSQEDIRIRLDTQPPAEHILRVGNQAQLMVVAKGVIYRAGVHVSGAESSRVTMKFAQPPQAVQRRNARRRRCDLNVSFRVVNDGCAGAWQEGAATDVSVGGMRLIVERSLEGVNELDLLFLLNGGVVSTVPDTRYGDEGFKIVAASVDARPVKTTARIAHRVSLPDGGTALGLTFRKLSTFDQLRLMRFTDIDVAAML